MCTHSNVFSRPVLIDRASYLTTFYVLSLPYDTIYFPGGLGGEGIPDPIPNSEVKLSIADDTAP